MKTKMLLATLALAMSPTFAMAMCGDGHAKNDTAAMSCAEGTTYDSETHRCVPMTG